MSYTKRQGGIPVLYEAKVVRDFSRDFEERWLNSGQLRTDVKNTGAFIEIDNTRIVNKTYAVRTLSPGYIERATLDLIWEIEQEAQGRFISVRQPLHLEVDGESYIISMRVAIWDR